MFWKWDAMWWNSELMWSSQAQVIYEPQWVGVEENWTMGLSSALPPTSFHPRGGSNCCWAEYCARPFTHINSCHLHTVLVKWVFYPHFIGEEPGGFDGFNDWSEMLLLLRGRVRIWASEPVLWTAEAQWWSPVQRSLWRGSQCSWEGCVWSKGGGHTGGHGWWSSLL